MRELMEVYGECLTRQLVLSVVIDFIWYFLIGVCIWVYFRFTTKKEAEFTNMQIYVTIFVGIGLLVLTLITISHIPETVTKIINPTFWKLSVLK